MEYGIKNHEFLEYGELNSNLYGIKLDSVRSTIDDGRTAVLDVSPQSLKMLRNSSEFMPFVVFLAAPGMEEMGHVYEKPHLFQASECKSTTETKPNIQCAQLGGFSVLKMPGTSISPKTPHTTKAALWQE